MTLTSFPETSSPVFDAVLSLLRSAVWGEDRFPFHAPVGTDWESVYQELRLQTVQCLPTDLLCREDPENKSLYIQHAARNMVKWMKIMQVQQAVCHQLDHAGIPCAVIKGAAAACYYPQPSSRVMGDIDLLIAPEQFVQACQIISENAEFIGENFRHKEYRKNGIIIELHHAFGIFRQKENNSFLDHRLFSAIPSAKYITTSNYQFSKLPTVENGLILLLHIDVHLEDGLGLRQIIDWMMFVDRELDDVLWHEEFEPILDRLERKKFAVTVTRMCQLYLGLRSNISWCSDADEPLCRDLMEYIFLQGNFGQKTQKGFNRTVSVLHASRNIPSFLKILQYRGCQNWKAITRYPHLKYFAWLYQLLRYLYYGLHSRHPVLLLRNALNTVDSKSKLMEELGVSHLEHTG